ncbi:MAG: methionyl-tRNA formyltransferase [Firmicutes bacterium]|nr:methionyl-tRNA formyltransferase [Candidatus Colivicinus equi]
MKTVLIGSVTTSKLLLETMIEMKFPISYVFSLDEQYSENVSDYCPIHLTAKDNNIPYKTFKKINDQENIEIIKELNPDYIFVIGLSQLIGSEIIKSAKVGCVGFHPAPLPKFRGRAANVWQQLLGMKESKSTLFFIDDGIDSGDILGQETYYIGDNDYAQDVCDNSDIAAVKAAKKVFREIMDGTLKPIKQDHSKATYTLKRTPEDGVIDWNLPIDELHLFVRAISKPYPGAFSMYDGKHKVIIYRADKLDNNLYYGFNGQIANIDNNYIDIVCNGGLLRVTEFDNVDNVKLIVGHRFK